MAKEYFVVWRASKKPRCFTSVEQWLSWFEVKSDARSPCVDCTPAFKARMVKARRCDRPETLFVRNAAGEPEGVSADDPRFARMLEVGAERPEGRSRWARLLRRIQPRGCKTVRRAIDEWLRRHDQDAA